ncbi:MAG: sulfotransferase, partial [Phycisphaerales bacterium]|nr:sulfotransferase [Phycisphaerales bacterium]
MPKNTDLNQMLQQATRHLEAQQWDKADRILRRALRQSPDNREILQKLAAVQIRLGRTAKALDTINTAIRLQPDDPELQVTLIDIHARSGRIGAAIQCATDAIARLPDRSELHSIRGRLFLHAGETNLSWDDMKSACELAPDDLDLLAKFVDATIARGIIPMDVRPAGRLAELQPFESLNFSRLGTIHRLNGDAPESMKAYDRATSINPRNTNALAGRAELLESEGNTDAAIELLRPHIESSSTAFLPLLAWTRIQSRLGNNERVVQDAEKWLSTTDRPPLQSTPILFRIGNALDAMSRHDDAFDAWTRANQPFVDRWDSAGHRSDVDSIIGTFDPERIGRPSTPVTTSPAPIFILGMFRSGTTMLEQVLAAHGQVHAVGESPALPSIIRSLPGDYPSCIETLDGSELARIASEYMEAVTTNAGDATRITDKLPMNYLNIGLITMLFPDARILHCRRDPLDVCLSCYSNHMTSNLAFTSNLTALGSTYREYERVMRHWK